MAMNSDAMGAAVAAAVDALSEAEKKDLPTVWKTICGEIVDHITANAAVATTVTVASVSGVTTGPGVSGPGAGTGTGGVS